MEAIYVVKMELFSPRDLNEATIEDWVNVLDNDRLNSILDRLDLTITGRPLEKRYRLFKCLIGQYVPSDFVPRAGEPHVLKGYREQLRRNFWDNYPESSDTSQSDNSLLESQSDLLQFMPETEQSQAQYVDTRQRANNIRTFGSQSNVTSSTVAPPISSTAPGTTTNTNLNTHHMSSTQQTIEIYYEGSLVQVPAEILQQFKASQGGLSSGPKKH